MASLHLYMLICNVKYKNCDKNSAIYITVSSLMCVNTHIRWRGFKPCC